jgi:hypothetical protein
MGEHNLLNPADRAARQAATTPPVGTAGGVGWSSAVDNSHRLVEVISPQLRIASGSVLWVGVTGTIGGTNPVEFGTQYDFNDSYPYFGIAIWRNTGDPTTFYFTNNEGVGTFTNVAGAAGAAVVGKLQVVSGRAVTGSDVPKLWVDGVLSGTASAKAADTVYGIDPCIPIGGFRPYTDRRTGSTMLLGALFGPGLSDADHLALHENPWQIFQPRGQKLYFDFGASPVVGGLPWFRF